MLNTGAVASLAEDWQSQQPLLDDAGFEVWARLLELRAGISVAHSRKSFLAMKLRMRMREIGINDFQQYFELVNSRKAGAVEWQILLNRLTIHETAFFRHPSSFNLLQEHYLPWFFGNNEPPCTLNVWSVGCATGEEAYSLALVIDQYSRRSGKECYYGVTGTDISRQSLALARNGIYPRQSVRKLAGELLENYFSPVDENNYQVNEGIRNRMCFAQINVQQVAEAPIGKMDVIFCQNLLIYFAKEQKLNIVDSLLSFLKPGGILILGIGEILGWSSPMMRRVDYPDTCAYQRIQ